MARSEGGDAPLHFVPVFGKFPTFAGTTATASSSSSSWRPGSGGKQQHGRPPMMLLQLQRVVPNGRSPRAYDVIVEPDAAADVESPRMALTAESSIQFPRPSQPDELEEAAPEAPQTAREAAKALPEVVTRAARASISVGARASMSVGAKDHTRKILGSRSRPLLPRPQWQRPQSQGVGAPQWRSAPPRSYIGRDSARWGGIGPHPREFRSLRAEREQSSEDYSVTTLRSDASSGSKAGPISRTISGLDAPGISRSNTDPFGSVPLAKMRNTDLAMQPTVMRSMTNPVSSESSSPRIDPRAFRLSAVMNSPSVSMPRKARLRSNVQIMRSGLLNSMINSFPQEAWDACDIPHPEREKEKAHAAHEAAKAQAAQEAAAKIKGIGALLSRAKIPLHDMANEEQEHDMKEEQAIAWLAKESRWHVLDVEEVREVFQQHAQDGHVTISNTTPGESPFKTLNALLADLFTADASPAEETANTLLKYLGLVRRRFNTTYGPYDTNAALRTTEWRNIAKKARLSRKPGAQKFTETVEDKRAQEIHFSEFFLALVQWLDCSQEREAGVSRCKLTRYTVSRDKFVTFQEPVPTVPTVAVVTAESWNAAQAAATSAAALVVEAAAHTAGWGHAKVEELHARSKVEVMLISPRRRRSDDNFHSPRATPFASPSASPIPSPYASERPDEPATAEDDFDEGEQFRPSSDFCPQYGHAPDAMADAPDQLDGPDSDNESPIPVDNPGSPSLDGSEGSEDSNSPMDSTDVLSGSMIASSRKVSQIDLFMGGRSQIGRSLTTGSSSILECDRILEARARSRTSGFEAERRGTNKMQEDLLTQ